MKEGLEIQSVFDLEGFQKDVYGNAKEKGFWDMGKTNLVIPTKLMLIVSELSEALEAHRKDKIKVPNNLDAMVDLAEDESYLRFFEKEVKDTFQDELADTVIRILDLAEGCGIDLILHMRAKHRYNKSRSSKHGGNY